MTRKYQSTALDDVLELVATHGTDVIAEAFTMILDRAMKLERSQVLGAEPYERTESRRGYANGFKPKTIKTAIGELNVSVPQTRGVEFYPSALDKGMRSDRALVLAIAEMYIQGIATRKVKAVLKELCGTSVSSTQVSRAAQELDGELEAWRQRRLGRNVYLILDARYEKVRVGPSVVSTAVLTAIGVDHEGRRSILGTSVSQSEAEIHWREFMQSLLDRGMYGVQLVVSDHHSGLKAARESVFPGVAWQRCQFHLIQNAMAYVPKISLRKQVAADLRSIFNSQESDEALQRLRSVVDKYRKPAPRLAAWIEENVPEGLAVLSRPHAHRRFLRTTNALERLHREIKRRTRVATLFPNDASLLRLVTAVLSEINDDWTTQRRYLNMEAE